MGCDIHAFTEIKVNGVWHRYNPVEIPRNYLLFGIIAGVRGTEPPVVKPRGIPEDVSVGIAIDYKGWGTDAHTPGWLTDSEILEVVERYKKHTASFPSHYRSPFTSGIYLPRGTILDHPHDPYGVHAFIHAGFMEDYRLVFWFDN